MNTFNSRAELEEHVKQKTRALILFCASWCPFCRQFYPHYEKAILRHKFDATICVYIDDDDNPLWDDYEIESVPTLVFFEQGKATRRLDARLGYGLSEQSFIDWLQKI
jgi:thioredoxin 1